MERTPIGLESQLGRVGERTRLPDYKPGPGITPGQHKLFHWLALNGGSGVLSKTRCAIIAQGEEMRTGQTQRQSDAYWDRCVATGHLSRDGGRLTLTDSGQAYVKQFPTTPEVTDRIRSGRVDPFPSMDDF